MEQLDFEPRALLVANRIGSLTRKFGTTGMIRLVFSLFHAELYLHQREYHADYFFFGFFHSHSRGHLLVLLVHPVTHDVWSNFGIFISVNFDLDVAHLHAVCFIRDNI